MSSSPHTGICGHSGHGCKAVGRQKEAVETHRAVSLCWAVQSLSGPKTSHILPSPTSAHIVLLWEVSNGGQRPHRHPFPLGLGHHQKDPPLLGPAVGQRWGESERKPQGQETVFPLSEPRSPTLAPSLAVLRQCPILPKHLPHACSPMPGLGTAVLEVLVWLHHLPIPPALTTHKLHLQVKGAGPMCPWGTLVEDGGRVGEVAATRP